MVGWHEFAGSLLKFALLVKLANRDGFSLTPEGFLKDRDIRRFIRRDGITPMPEEMSESKPPAVSMVGIVLGLSGRILSLQPSRWLSFLFMF